MKLENLTLDYHAVRKHSAMFQRGLRNAYAHSFIVWHCWHNNIIQLRSHKINLAISPAISNESGGSTIAEKVQTAY
ncbi:MAG: hypothetical protein DSM106950_42420 [Stigonema ocellatum SAG 48.90 = DSM 106950]|nr:hypothetical protein [Stigonema ocellatum SAG 48.90 = DSM 106950]